MMRYKSSGVVKQIVDVKERNNESSVNRHFICLEDAIEIVKAGVKNENKQE